MNEFYAEIFKEYENEKFPLRLVSECGYMVFKSKAELKDYYEKKSKVMDIDEATDELAEVIADFDLSDEELIQVRKTMKERVEKAQELMLKL